MILGFKVSLFLYFSLSFLSLSAQQQSMNAIYSGIAWYDNNWNMVSAHGAGITVENNIFYLFGEFKSDTSNAFAGFSCYSSSDLYNWKFENIALSVQDSGRLGTNRVGERPKVLKCPQTGEYIMYMHSDDIRYKDQCVAYATSNKINGEFIFKGPLLFNNEPIRKWDMGVFQDSDGRAYLITHSGNLYELSDDYKSISKQVVHNMTGKCEAPAIFKKDSIYFWMGSDLTSWERNDNYYFTAKSLEGPWVSKGIFAPKGSLTWNSQTTFVLPVLGSIDTTFLFMGDRWAFPCQNSAATYVWQPLRVMGDSIFLPDYKESWQIDTKTGIWSMVTINGIVIENSDLNRISYSEGWVISKPEALNPDTRSDVAGASFSINFEGSQIGFYGTALPNGGYARVQIEDKYGAIIISTLVDMYCLYAETSLKFLSPVLKRGEYKLHVKVMGEHGNWYKKDGTKFGSSGNFVAVDKIIIIQ